MIHHPVLLLAKLILAGIIVAVLLALYSVLSPEDFLVAVVIAIAVFLVGVFALWVYALRAMRRPDSLLSKGLTLPDVDGAEQHAAAEKRRATWVGRRGIALSPLRPSGTAEIDGRRISVVAEGEFIPAKSPIFVRTVDGPRIVVRKAEPSEEPPGSDV